jgi:hypothetical protein
MSKCDCIEKANKALAVHNAVVDARECFNTKTGKIERVLTIPTRKINARIRRPLYILIGKFCPFCGKARKP